QAEDGIRDFHVTGVQTCALPIFYSLIPLTAREPLRKRGAIFITWRASVNTFLRKNRNLKVLTPQQPSNLSGACRSGRYSRGSAPQWQRVNRADIDAGATGSPHAAATAVPGPPDDGTRRPPRPHAGAPSCSTRAPGRRAPGPAAARVATRHDPAAGIRPVTAAQPFPPG